MMLSCKEATELVSRSLDHRLAWPQRIALRLHLIICHRCRRYVQHLLFLKRVAVKIDQQIEKGRATLSPQARQKIGDHLQQHHSNSS